MYNHSEFQTWLSHVHVSFGKLKKPQKVACCDMNSSERPVYIGAMYEKNPKNKRLLLINLFAKMFAQRTGIYLVYKLCMF